MTRKSFNVIAILSHYGLIPDVSTYDIEIKINCPFHEEIVPSCNVSLTNGIYHCFGCGQSGNIIDLISRIEKVNKIKAMIIATKISDNTKINNLSDDFISEKTIIDNVLFLERAKIFFYGLPVPSWDVIKEHYLVKRGFNSDILKKFDIRINQSSTYPIIIPLYEEEEFRGYILRRIDKEEPKYLFSRGFGKQNAVIGNLYRTPILVVEGVLDLMKAIQYGFKNTCAILGWKASSYQLTKINEASNKIICALDNDASGKRGYTVLKNSLGEKVVRFYYPSKKKDICELTQEEFDYSIDMC